MSSTRPAAVRWIVGLSRVRILLALIAMGGALYFMSPAESEMVESFRRGWVRSSGFTLEEYGPEQAGEVAGTALVPLVLSALILMFVRRRKLKALRVAAAVNAIMSWSQPLIWPLTIAILVLANRQSTREYCEAGTSAGKASRQVRAPRRPAVTHP